MSIGTRGCLLLNAGISIVCMSYKMSSEDDDHWTNSCNRSQFIQITVNHFARELTTSDILSSESSMIKVYSEDKEMQSSFVKVCSTYVGTILWQGIEPPSNCSQTFWLMVTLFFQSSNDVLIVKYAMLDVDSWISTILPSMLCKENFKYHCLCDYNLEVVDVRSIMYHIMYV